MGAVVHVMIAGRVQGVGYRAWVAHQAGEHHLQGWVRNRRDGSVEALFAGPEKVVADMIELCRRGPASARVASVHQDSANADELAQRRTGETFSVLPTI